MDRGTILVVDDEPNIAELIELYLKRDHYALRVIFTRSMNSLSHY